MDESVISLDVPDMGAQMRRIKRLAYDLLDVRDGDHVLDAGCGAGDDVRALASSAGRRGRVVGIDQRADQIAEARRRSDGSGMAVEFFTGDVQSLEFASGSFDRCRADRTLFYVTDIALAVQEMVRVLRPGGRMVAAEPDWETLTIDPADRALTRAVLHGYCDGLPQGWAGRRLPALFRDAGLSEIVVSPITVVTTDAAVLNQFFPLEAAVERASAAGTIAAGEGAAWLDRIEEAGRAGRLFATLTALIVGGRKR